MQKEAAYLDGRKQLKAAELSFARLPVSPSPRLSSPVQTILPPSTFQIRL